MSMAAFHQDVLLLVAELTRSTGPCLSLEMERSSRRRALREFWEAWLAHPRRGFHSTPDRLDALELAVLERGWLSQFDTSAAAVAYLRQSVRARSKPIECPLELREALLPAPVRDQVEDLLEEALAALDGPARSFLQERLAGETWQGAAVKLGMDPGKACGIRKSLQKKFAHLSAYRRLQPKRVRARR